jgi:hypothetical protein
MSSASSISSVAHAPATFSETRFSDAEPAGRHSAAAAVAAPEAPPVAAQIKAQAIDIETLRNAVLTALEEAGHRMAASTLEEGEWSVTSSTLTIKVSSGEQMIVMTFGPEQRRVIQQTLEQSLGRSLRLSVISGAAKRTAAVTSRPATPGSTRAKAVQHPVVRRMMEKFGAELRTVLDGDR